MLFWKEWRETRFGFLTILFFMTGLYASLPAGRMLNEEYWIGIFLTFFGMAIALVMGAGALAPEVESETIVFVLSKPIGRAKYLATKYAVRGSEVLLLVAIPIGFMVFNGWKVHPKWWWCAPYIGPQNILAGIAVVVFTFSGAFFCSVLFRKQALSALAGITLLATYLAWRGVAAYRKVYNAQTLETDILILILLIAGIFFGSLFAFRVKEY